MSREPIVDDQKRTRSSNMARMTDFRRTLCCVCFSRAWRRRRLWPASRSAFWSATYRERHNGFDRESALDCVYEDEIAGGGPQHYIGKLTKVGANIGVNGPGDLVWGVVAETNALAPGR